MILLILAIKDYIFVFSKTAVVQPRKVKRQNISTHLRRKSDGQQNRSEDDTDDTAVDTYEMSDMHYEIKGDMYNEDVDGNQEDDDECEETVIYEIIDEI